jgi:uncharacterized protein YjbJ (UPF0337 family)
MNRDQIKGAADKAKGAIEDTAGKITGDAKLQAEGKLEKAKGAARSAVGDVKEAVKNAKMAQAMRDVAQTASSRFPVYVSKAVSQDGFFVAVIYVMSFATKSINPFVPRARRSYLASSSASSTIAPLATFSVTRQVCLGVDVDLAVNPILISRESFDRVILRGEDIKLLEDCSPDALRQPSSCHAGKAGISASCSWPDARTATRSRRK